MMNLMSFWKRQLLLVICIGLIQAALYYVLGICARGDGELAVAHPDTLLYAQAARRIAEGHFFSFSSGTDPSTGTTSVLYPFVLAVLYLLGFTGDSLLQAGYFINTLFYILGLVGWSFVARRWFKEDDLSRQTAMIMLACFGPYAYCALSQCDIGLWLLASSFLLWGLLADRKVVYVPLLLLSPWIRPEGMILIVAFCVVLLYRCATEGFRKERLQEWCIAAGALLSIIGVFALNFLLTGHAQFASVVNKGYFTHYPFFSAVYATAVDAMRLAKSYFLGFSSDAPRDFEFIPVLGALMLWAGVFSRIKRGISWDYIIWILAVLGSFWTVSTSAMQDMNLDRYLAWTWPLLILLIAEGCSVWGGFMKSWGLSTLPSLICCSHAAIMSVVFLALFYVSAEQADRYRSFAKQCEQVMQPGEPVGVWSLAGIAYEFSNRRVAHLCGVYSPEFLFSNPVSFIEVLKHEPKTRFRYYYYEAQSDLRAFGCARDVILPEQVLKGPDCYELRKANWEALDAAACAPQTPVGGAVLCDQVDVAYQPDEERHHYEIVPNYHMEAFDPFIQSGDLEGTTIVDAGRLVFGADEMTVSASPGKDLHVVMRTYPSRSVISSKSLTKNVSRFEFDENMRLNLQVDGKEARSVSFQISTNGFRDVSFTVPGSSITTDSPRLTLLGNHITFGYWFYQ